MPDNGLKGSLSASLRFTQLINPAVWRVARGAWRLLNRLRYMHVVVNVRVQRELDLVIVRAGYTIHSPPIPIPIPTPILTPHPDPPPRGHQSGSVTRG